MISQITGNIDHVSDNTLTLSVSGLSYEVYIPTAIMNNVTNRFTKNTRVSLVTYHYYQTDPSKSIPILIGFSNRIEKDFFEKFITVSGVGPKAAVRALSQPIPQIAQAIDGGDLPFLKSLPGIGEQRAKEIIAKLQGKMGRFGLMREPEDAATTVARKTPDESLAQEEAVEILLQLQYKKDEAKEMVRKVCARVGTLKSAEEILNEVYRQRKDSGSSVERIGDRRKE